MHQKSKKWKSSLVTIGMLKSVALILAKRGGPFAMFPAHGQKADLQFVLILAAPAPRKHAPSTLNKVYI